MPDLVDYVVNILSNSQNRAEIVGQNVANAARPAFKRRVAFSTLLETAGANRWASHVTAATDFTPGKLVRTDNPFDLAISGTGFFAVHRDGIVRYIRAGRFMRDPDGRLIDAFGAALQKAEGGDLVASEASFRVRRSGEVSTSGGIVGRIAVFVPTDASALVEIVGGFGAPPAGMAPLETAEVIQGAYEASNVSTGDEMVSLMAALRQAESGQRVMIAYDDLMGRVLSTFGEGAR